MTRTAKTTTRTTLTESGLEVVVGKVCKRYGEGAPPPAYTLAGGYRPGAAPSSMRRLAPRPAVAFALPTKL